MTNDDRTIEKAAILMTNFVCEPSVLLGAMREVMRTNQDEEVTLKDWCIAMESLGEICWIIARRERAYVYEDEYDESPEHNLPSLGDEATEPYPSGS